MVEVYFELVTAEKFKTTLIKKVLIESSDIFNLVKPCPPWPQNLLVPKPPRPNLNPNSIYCINPSYVREAFI